MADRVVRHRPCGYLIGASHSVGRRHGQFPDPPMQGIAFAGSDERQDAHRTRIGRVLLRNAANR